MWINEETLKTYKFVHEVRADINASLPEILTDETLAGIGVKPVLLVEPQYDHIAQTAIEVAPMQIDGVWTQQWQIIDLLPEQVAANQAAKTANDARLVAEKIEALWQAADRYTSSYISGVAIGILTIGVMQQKPKALAVSTWSSAVWAEYYARKALVTATSVDNHDFSSFGPIPHSVPELQAEVGL